MIRDDVAKIDELCPFDGAAPFEPVTSPGLVGCPTDGCPLHYVYITREQWNRRAISSALSAQGEMPEEPLSWWVDGDKAVYKRDYDKLLEHAQSLQAKINATAHGNASPSGVESTEHVAAAPVAEIQSIHPIDYLAAPSDRKQEAGLVERLRTYGALYWHGTKDERIAAMAMQDAADALAARDEEIAGLREFHAGLKVDNERLVQRHADDLFEINELNGAYDYLMKVAPWSESNDMSAGDEMICGIGGLLQRTEAAESTIAELRAKLAKSTEEWISVNRSWLAMARCPNYSCHEGMVINTGPDPVYEPCEWCHEKDNVLSAAPKDKP